MLAYIRGGYLTAIINFTEDRLYLLIAKLQVKVRKPLNSLSQAKILTLTNKNYDLRSKHRNNYAYNFKPCEKLQEQKGNKEL